MKATWVIILLLAMSCTRMSTYQRGPNSLEEAQAIVQPLELKCDGTRQFEEGILYIEAENFGECEFNINLSLYPDHEKFFELSLHESGVIAVNTLIDSNLVGAWNSLGNHYYMPVPRGSGTYRITFDPASRLLTVILKNEMKMIFNVDSGLQIPEGSDLVIDMQDPDILVTARENAAISVQYRGPIDDDPAYYAQFLDRLGEGRTRANWKDDGLRVSVTQGLLLDSQNYWGDIEAWKSLLPDYRVVSKNAQGKVCKVKNKDIFLPYNNENDHYYVPKLSDQQIVELLKRKCPGF